MIFVHTALTFFFLYDFCFSEGSSVQDAVFSVADVAAQTMKHFPNASSFSVEMNHISPRSYLH